MKNELDALAEELSKIQRKEYNKIYSTCEDSWRAVAKHVLEREIKIRSEERMNVLTSKFWEETKERIRQETKNKCWEDVNQPCCKKFCNRAKEILKEKWKINDEKKGGKS